MIYRTYTPQPPLSDFVAFLWFCDGYTPLHRQERMLPSGIMELVISLHEETIHLYDQQGLTPVQSFHGSLIRGAQTEATVIDTAPQKTIIGVHFQPGGAFPFLGFPADELYNAHVSLETLWGANGNDLREQLLEAVSPEAKFHLLEQALLKQASIALKRRPDMTFALETFQHASTPVTIANVADQVGLSQRHFIQVFKEQVGMTPKRYCRVRRFQEVLRLINRMESIDWVDVALACGYFDQAHFIHDFRAFSGLTPASYFAQRSNQLNHFPLSD